MKKPTRRATVTPARSRWPPPRWPSLPRKPPRAHRRPTWPRSGSPPSRRPSPCPRVHRARSAGHPSTTVPSPSTSATDPSTPAGPTVIVVRRRQSRLRPAGRQRGRAAAGRGQRRIDQHRAAVEHKSTAVRAAVARAGAATVTPSTPTSPTPSTARSTRSARRTDCRRWAAAASSTARPMRTTSRWPTPVSSPTRSPARPRSATRISATGYHWTLGRREHRLGQRRIGRVRRIARDRRCTTRPPERRSPAEHPVEQLPQRRRRRDHRCQRQDVDHARLR